MGKGGKGGREGRGGAASQGGDRLQHGFVDSCPKKGTENVMFVEINGFLRGWGFWNLYVDGIRIAP